MAKEAGRGGEDGGRRCGMQGRVCGVWRRSEIGRAAITALMATSYLPEGTHQSRHYMLINASGICHFM